MRMVYMSEIQGEAEFAKQAAEHFAKHPEHSSFGECVPGSYLALRWGMGNDCVLVLRLDGDHVPTNYQQLVRAMK